MEESVARVAKDMVRIDTFMREKYGLKVGDTVRLVQATYGWGMASKGATGVIEKFSWENRDTQQVVIRIVLDAYPEYMWNGVPEDVEKVVVKVVVDSVVESTYERLRHLPRSMCRVWRNDAERLYSEIKKREDQVQIAIRNRFAVQEKIIKLERGDYARSIEKISKSAIKMMLERKYESINFGDTDRGEHVLSIVTNPVTVRFADLVIPLGKYVIKVTPNGEFKVACVNPNIRPNVRYPHPHVNTECSPCFGDYRNGIMASFESFDVIGLLSQLWDWLHSINESSWYHDVHFFMEKVELRCPGCWKMKEECTCGLSRPKVETCGECNKVMTECTCVRCPADKSVMPGGYDDYCKGTCQSWNKTASRCEYRRSGS